MLYGVLLVSTHSSVETTITIAITRKETLRWITRVGERKAKGTAAREREGGREGESRERAKLIEKIASKLMFIVILLDICIPHSLTHP